MNKQELVKRISADAEVTTRQASYMLDSALEIIMDTVASGEKVILSGFGVFEPKARSARFGTNPNTQEKMEIPAATVPSFKPGVIFKEKVDR